MNKERSRKILFFITKSNWGGAQKYVFELANEFNKKENYEITVASGGGGLMIEKLNEHNIKHIPLITLENNFKISTVYKNIKEILDVIKKEKPDIIHLNSSKISLFGVIAGKIYGKTKIIFASHGWPFNEDRNILIKTILKAMMTFVILLSDKIIVGSKAVKKQTPLYKIIKKNGFSHKLQLNTVYLLMY